MASECITDSPAGSTLPLCGTPILTKIACIAVQAGALFDNGSARLLSAFCRLIRVEEAVLQGQGCVVRLAGLYHAQVKALQHSPVLASRRTHLSHTLNLHKNSIVVLEGQGCARRLADSYHAQIH